MKIDFIERPATKLREFCGWKIWEKPKSLHTYTIGADVAEGVGRDASCAQILDVQTGVLVAQYWSPEADVDNYSAELYKAANFYNKAHLIIEANNHGHAVIVHLTNTSGGLAYHKLYKRYQYDEYTQKKTPKVGLKTTGGTTGTKARIIENLKSALRDGDITVYDAETVNELTNFVRDPKTGRMCAAGGMKSSRDDRVMALALAYEQAKILKETPTYHNFNQEPQIKYDPMTGFPSGGDVDDRLF